MTASKTKKGYKKDSELSLVSLSMPFLFMSLAGFAASMINTLILALVPNTGIIYSEAVGSASRIYNIFTTLLTFVGGGVGVVVSQRIGRQDDMSIIKKSIYTSIFAAIVFAISITILSEIIMPFGLYGFLKPGTEQYNNALLYGQVIALCILLIAPKNALGSVINSYGYVKHTIIWNMMTIIIDICFTLLFVIVIDFGIMGAAIGTIIANVVTLIYAIIIFNLKVYKFKFSELRFDKPILKQLLKISIPIGFEKISYNFAMLIVGVFVAQIGMRLSDAFIKDNGTNILNLSHTIIQTFSSVITVVSIAFSQGGSIICARMMGNQDYEGAKKLIKKCFVISIIGDMALAVGMFFLQPYLIDFFKLTQGEEVKPFFNDIRKVCFIPFLLLIFMQVGRTVNIIYLVGPMSYGNPIFNSISSIICTWIVVLVFGFTSLFCSSDQFGNALYGINGIYLLIAMDEISRGIFNYWWWKSDKWKRKFKKTSSGVKYTRRRMNPF